MAGISRRDFLKRTATSTAAAGFLAANWTEIRAAAAPLGLPIGSQTYPHRAILKEPNGFASLCKTFQEIGVTSLELCSGTPMGYKEFAPLANAAETRKIMADHGIKSPSAHFTMPELRNDHQRAIDWAKEVGMTQMMVATMTGKMDPPGITTMDEVKRAADEYNKIAAVAAKNGLAQGLHHEGFEHARIGGPDGQRVFDALFGLLDPKLVFIQFQMSAMRTVGDPITYFNKYPGRFISMHLQDLTDTSLLPPPAPPVPGQARQGGAGGGRGAGTPVGKGKIEWAKVFTAAKTGGVKNYFVEQSMDLTKESVAFLKTLNV